MPKGSESGRFGSAAAPARKLSREEYEAQLRPLRVDLLNAQFDLRTAPFPVLIVLSGDHRQACEEVYDALHEWLDARYLEPRVFLEPDPADQRWPRERRYWSALPPRGAIGIFFGAWVYDALASRVREGCSRASFERQLARVCSLERTLIDDGTLLLKFWCHTPKKLIKKRLRRIERARHSWRVAKRDRQLYRRHRALVRAGAQLVGETDRPGAPWHLVPCGDARARDLQIARAICGALQARLEPAPAVSEAPPPQREIEPRSQPGGAGPLAQVDLSLRLDRDAYDAQLESLQARLAELSLEADERGISSVLVFEGWDAAGKGGAIRRITGAMSAQHLRVIPIAAPTQEAAARHYLWRFWRQLPAAGQMAIFDRSWYGRVLVERVEGFAPESRWRQAYREIVEFEAQLVESGMMLRKFWLHIDPDEQLRRFLEREKTPYKKYKITAEDYRNRERWSEYERAADAMLARTHSERAPWLPIAANDKHYARVRVLRAVCGGLEERLGRVR